MHRAVCLFTSQLSLVLIEGWPWVSWPGYSRHLSLHISPALPSPHPRSFVCLHGVLLAPKLLPDKHFTALSAKCSYPAATTAPCPTLARWRLRRHTGSRVHRRPRRLLCRSTGRLARRRRRQPSCNVFSTSRAKFRQLRLRTDSFPAPCSTLAQGHWPDPVPAVCPSVQHGSWIRSWSLPTCLQHRQPQTSPICKSWSTAGSADQDVNLRKTCFRSCRSIYLERSSELF